MPVRPKHWDRRRYPHPNIAAVPVVFVDDGDYFLTATDADTLSVGDDMLAHANATGLTFTPGAAQSITFSATSSGSAFDLGIEVIGLDQFGDEVSAFMSIDTAGSQVGASTAGVGQGAHKNVILGTAFSRITSMKVVRKGTTSGRSLVIGLNSSATNAVGLPVRVSNTTYGGGGEVLAIVDRVGAARTAAQVRVNAQRNSISNLSTSMAVGVNHVFFDFDKVAAF